MLRVFLGAALPPVGLIEGGLTMWQVTVWRGGSKPPIAIATLWDKEAAETLRLERQDEAPALWWFLRRVMRPC
jgi:hypothetical protein